MAGAVDQAGYGPTRQEDRHDDDGGDGHLAIHADDERFVTSALEDIQKRFNNGALHELFGYILKVPVTISPQHKLGLYLRFSAKHGIVGLEILVIQRNQRMAKQIARR